jgi:hypothetical protein
MVLTEQVLIPLPNVRVVLQSQIRRKGVVGWTGREGGREEGGRTSADGNPCHSASFS